MKHRDLVALLYAVRQIPIRDIAESKYCPKYYLHKFVISTDKNIFYCYDCEWGGDQVAYIQKAHNMKKAEAARYLANRFEIKLLDENERPI